MKDEEIVALYWERDEQAVLQTKEKYEHYLTKISYNILADLEDCRECVNDTYLAAWNSMPEHRPNVLSTYLGRMIRQISIDVFRKKTSQKRHDSEYALSLEELGDVVSGGVSPEQALEADRLKESLSSFLRGLSGEERKLFVGRYYFFDSLKRTADYLGMSEGKAKSMLYRIRMRLKEYLVKEGFEP